MRAAIGYRALDEAGDNGSVQVSESVLLNEPLVEFIAARIK